MDLPDRSTRRRACAGLASLCSLALAGCLGDDESDGDGPDDADPADDGGPPELRLNGVSLTEAFPIELVEPDTEPFTGFADGDVRVTNVHWHEHGNAHWHFQPLAIPLGDSRRVRTRFVDTERKELSLGDDGPYGQRVSTTEETPDGLVSIAVDGGHVTFTGEREGSGRLVFELLGDGETLWTSPELEFDVA